jgi:hypothetical protein
LNCGTKVRGTKVRKCGSTEVRECGSVNVDGSPLHDPFGDWAARRAPTGLVNLAHLPQNCWGRLNFDPA